MLKAEGFRYQGYVDIFDGGAAVDVLFEDIKAIKRSRVAECHTATVSDGVRVLVCNRELSEFRCTLTTATLADQGERITIAPEAAEALHVSAGASLRYLPLA